MGINNDLTVMLNQEGCYIIGFADLRVLPNDIRDGFDYGILIGMPYTKEAMLENNNGKPARYYAELHSISRQLTHLANITADYLTQQGYQALAQTPETIARPEGYYQQGSTEYFRTFLPHKTVATLAGVGWIGKNAMLVTKEAGSALRMRVVLTNAPLECGTPITKSKCPKNCMVCVNICPGKAPKGVNWEVSVDRDEFFDAEACFAAARARAKEMLGVDEVICGLCISHCPFTKAGLGYK